MTMGLPERRYFSLLYASVVQNRSEYRIKRAYTNGNVWNNKIRNKQE